MRSLRGLPFNKGIQQNFSVEDPKKGSFYKNFQLWKISYTSFLKDLKRISIRNDLILPQNLLPIYEFSRNFMLLPTKDFLRFCLSLGIHHLQNWPQWPPIHNITSQCLLPIEDSLKVFSQWKNSKVSFIHEKRVESPSREDLWREA